MLAHNILAACLNTVNENDIQRKEGVFVIYDNIERLSKEKDMTIQQLEIKAGVGNGTVGKWRNQKPLADTLDKVAKALGVTVDELMHGGN